MEKEIKDICDRNPCIAQLFSITQDHLAVSEHDSDSWRSQDDVVKFLVNSHTKNEMVLYSTLGRSFFYGFLVSKQAIKKIEVPNLVEYHCDQAATWSITGSLQFERPRSVILKDMKQIGEPLFFIRNFSENGKTESYFELSEKIAHIFDLHHTKLSDSETAYKKINENGDIETAVNIFDFAKLGHSGIVATIRTLELKKILKDLQSVYVLLCVSNRIHTDDRDDCSEGSLQKLSVPQRSFYYNLLKFGKASSILRGFRVIHQKIEKNSEYKQYESFVAFDHKNQKSEIISCDPRQVNAVFPHDLTPIFFNPEVLNKYKNDPQKYQFINANRAVQCSDRWMIKFDINEENQVHVYLCDLRLIPYQEQSYWKSYNISSMASISSRSFNSDFLCKFEDTRQLPQILQEKLKLLAKSVPWYTLKDPSLLANVNYVFADNKQKEWQDQIIFLAQLIVEGLDKSSFASKANKLGIKYEKKEGSLKIMRRILSHQNIDREKIEAVMNPLKDLQQLRTMFVHAMSPEKREKRISELLLDHKKSFRIHFDFLLRQSIKSIQLMTELAGAGIL